MLWLQDESCLHTHELLDNELMWFRQDGVSLLVADKRTCGQLDSIELFAKEPVDDLSIRQIRTNNEHY